MSMGAAIFGNMKIERSKNEIIRHVVVFPEPMALPNPTDNR